MTKPTIKVTKHGRGRWCVGRRRKQEWFSNRTAAWDRALALVKEAGGEGKASIVFVDMSEGA